MAATRTSSRQAAQKAKEAITSTAEPKSQGTAGAKRKGATEKAPEPKKGKKGDQEPKKEPEESKEVDQRAKEEESHKPTHDEDKVKEEEKAMDEEKGEKGEEKKDEEEPSKAGAGGSISTSILHATLKLTCRI